MDTFFEQIVVKKKTAADYALIALIIFAALAVSMLIFFFLIPLIGVLATVLMMGALYGAWWLITNRSVEFEYCVTSGDIITGDMDIDMIVARRKRKRIVSVAGSKIESLIPYRAAEFAGRRFDRTVMAAPSLNEEGLWAFTYHSKKKGHTLVIFKPNDRVLKEFVATLPKLVQLEAKRRVRLQDNFDE